VYNSHSSDSLGIEGIENSLNSFSESVLFKIPFSILLRNNCFVESEILLSNACASIVPVTIESLSC
jgi:hypothetical protein